jgi:hypothetical protein
MSQPEIVTAERLRHHVERLAGEIGERHIFRPAALAAAREYIAAEWGEQGYQVSLQWYETSGHSCANLEVARGGSSRPEQILVVGPTMTRYAAALAPMTTRAALPPCSKSRGCLRA